MDSMHAPLPVRRRSRLQRIDARYGYLFVAPAVIGFLIFVAVPLVGVFTSSLYDYNSLSGRSTFAGLENFIELAQSPVFRTVLMNTAVFSLAVVPINLTLGLVLAVLVNQRLPGIAVFRTAYFVPVVMSLVAWSLVWDLLLQDRGGINAWLAGIGIEGPNWLASSEWAMPSIVGVQVLKGVGVSMILFLAALQDVPQELREAAIVDGASRWQAFRQVTLPLISPTMFMVAMLATINSLKAFAQVYLLTNGGPGYSTYVLGFYIYDQAFRSFQIGYASSAAVVLFVIVLGITVLQWWGRKRWVFHES